MINPLSNSLAGMMAATKKLDGVASNIANASTPGSNVNIEEELIKGLEAKQAYQANATVLSRTASMQKALGQIFDETA